MMKAMCEMVKQYYDMLIHTSTIALPIGPYAFYTNIEYENMFIFRPDSASKIAAAAEITPETNISMLDAI